MAGVLGAVATLQNVDPSLRHLVSSACFDAGFVLSFDRLRTQLSMLTFAPTSPTSPQVASIPSSAERSEARIEGCGSGHNRPHSQQDSSASTAQLVQRNRSGHRRAPEVIPALTRLTPTRPVTPLRWVSWAQTYVAASAGATSLTPPGTIAPKAGTPLSPAVPASL